MTPSGPSPFDDDDEAVQLPNAPVREKSIVAQRSGSMARTTKTYPQQEGTMFPRELLEFAIDAAREGYVRTANMGAAFNMMKRQVKDRWTVEKGPSGYVFKEHVHPLEAYLRPGVRHDEAHKPTPPMPGEKPAIPESETVADARKRWDAAKASGDAGAMTRAANDLLRALEADRAARGESALAQKEGGRHPTSEVLAPGQAGHNAGSTETVTVGQAFQRPDGEGKYNAHEISSETHSERFDGSAAPDSTSQNMPSLHVRESSDLGDEVAEETPRHLASFISRSLLAEAERGTVPTDPDLTRANEQVEVGRQARVSGAGVTSGAAQTNSFEGARGRAEPLSNNRGRWRDDQIRQASKRFFRDEDIVRQPKMADAFEQFREEAMQRGIDSQTAFHVFRYVADVVRAIAEQMMRDSGMSPEEARQRAVDLVLLTDPRLRKNGWWRDGDTLQELARDRNLLREGLPPEWLDNRPYWKAYEPLTRERRRDAMIDFFTWLTGDRDVGRFYGGRLDDVASFVDRGTPLRELYERRIQRNLPWNWWEDPFLILDVGAGSLVKKGGEKVLRRVLGAPTTSGRAPGILSIFNPKRDSVRRWRDYAPPVEPVVGGTTGNGSPVITVARTKRSLWGFTPESFTAVRERFVGQVRAAGYTDARVGIVGSAATGRSHKGLPFRQDSDLDLAIVSKTMMDMIRSKRELLDVGVRYDNKASMEFYDENALRALGLEGLIDEIKRLTGRRKVTIVIYESEEAMGAQKAGDFFDFSMGWEGM